MAEFIFKRADYTNADPDKDRRGVHKKTDLVNYKPDGWSDHPNWAVSSYPKDFVVVKVPGITFEEAQANDHRKPWKDDFDYEIVASRPVQGEYDIRIFEKNPGNLNQNCITGAKAIKIRDYLVDWGCSAFSLSATDAQFTFSLWGAVRSENFWDVSLVGTKVTFTLNSYSAETGVARITAVPTQEAWPEEMTEENIGSLIVHKIIEHEGTVISQIYPNFVFEIDRSSVLAQFRSDVKRKIEDIYIRHQYCISQADHDAVVAAGGMVTITKAQFLSKLIDKMAT